MNKQEYDTKIKDLNQEIAGIKADCGILLKENLQLLDVVLKLNPTHPILKNLFTMNWRDSDYNEKENEGE